MKRKMNRSLLLAFVTGFLSDHGLARHRNRKSRHSGLAGAGKVVVDGKTDDWDLSAGVFTCGDVENRRDTMSALDPRHVRREQSLRPARWNDETPLNNPGQTIG